MFRVIRNVSGVLGLFCAFAAGGRTAISALYSLFDFGSISANVMNVVNYVFDIIFSSLHILGFFIRPATIRAVGLSFVSYFILKMEFKFFIVSFRLMKVLYKEFTLILNKTVSSLVNLLSGLVGMNIPTFLN